MGNFFTDALGIGIGSMEIRLFEEQVPWGELVIGRLELSLPEPLEASGLRVGIRARKRSVRHRQRSSGHSLSTANPIVYDVHKDLSGARAYRSEGFNFTIPLPSRPPTLRDINSDLADIVTVARALQGSFDAEPTWVVYGTLSRPWKRALTQEISLFPT